MGNFSFWQGPNCKEGGIPLPASGVWYQLEIHNDPRPNGEGIGTRRNKLSLEITNEIQQSEIYTGDLHEGGDREALVQLCVRPSLSTENGIEVNFQENIIGIQYVFTDEYILIQNANVAPPLIDLTNVELGVKLRAYDCSDSSGGVLTQGMVIRVCIEPNLQAVRDGFRMKSIEWFEYSKSDPNVTQVAVLDRTEADESHGLATMQLGDHSSDSRRLSGDYATNLRGLQEALPEAVEQEFDLPLEVISSPKDSTDATTNTAL